MLPIQVLGTRARNMFKFLLFLLLLVVNLPSSLEVECFHARSALPILSHCQDITDAIAYLSRMPGENDLRAWGRRLPTSQYTEKLPKVYWLSGRGPTTCAVQVDVNPTNYFAVDSFRQSNVSVCAARVVDQCLARQRRIGLDYPTQKEYVYVKIVRSDSPLQLNVLGTYEVGNVSLPGTTSVLHVASGNVIRKGGGHSSEKASAGPIQDQ